MKENNTYHPYAIGEKIYLRGLKKKDIYGNWFNWFNDSEVTYYLYSGERPNSYERLEKYYLGIQDSESDFVFAIILKENNEHIGNCGLHEVDWVNRRAALGIVIGQKGYRGIGIGQETSKLLIRYGFETLNLNRIYLGVNNEHREAIECYKKCGFIEEGISKKEIYRNGKYYDALRMGILIEDYKR